MKLSKFIRMLAKELFEVKLTTFHNFFLHQWLTSILMTEPSWEPSWSIKEAYGGRWHKSASVSLGSQPTTCCKALCYRGPQWALEAFPVTCSWGIQKGMLQFVVSKFFSMLCIMLEMLAVHWYYRLHPQYKYRLYLCDMRMIILQLISLLPFWTCKGFPNCYTACIAPPRIFSYFYDTHHALHNMFWTRIKSFW